jgi:segregation and condensation protein B
MSREEIMSAVEAVLFAAGDPVPIADLAQALEMTELELRPIIEEMIDRYRCERRGIQINFIEDSLQLSTRREHADLIRRVLSPVIRQSLSAAALETLSIIAYMQPITRGEVEQIRGVRCEYAIASLLKRNLIEPVGHRDTVGHPRLYGTTTEFLRAFGLSSMDELPRLEELNAQTGEHDAPEDISDPDKSDLPQL